jgi:hypothetical protein
MAGKLGDYIVEYRYRVDPIHRERLLALLGEIRYYVLDLGLSAFEVWGQEEDTWTVIELHAYDSWSHFQRVAQKPTPPEIDKIYGELDRLIEGGLPATQRVTWAPWSLPK